MKRLFKSIFWLSLFALLAAAAAGYWFVQQRQPQRAGTLTLAGLSAPASVRYDDYGVPHIQAANEADLYHALGYVHAQDRLFQMEMLRRLARGELAEVLGPPLLPTDRLFRALRIRERADQMAADLTSERAAQQASTKALNAYLDGVNQFQDTHPAPLEFALLGIPRRPFTAADTMSVAGYLAYSFAAALRSEPVLSQIRDQLGPDYLKPFDAAWQPQGVLAAAPAPSASAPAAMPAAASAVAPVAEPVAEPTAAPAAASAAAASAAAMAAPLRFAAADWLAVQRLAALSRDAVARAALAQFEGSNAWAIGGGRTESGKPLLAGDPHIAFAVPAVWYEAHLSAPGFDFYGHFAALIPNALLGRTPRHAWSLTMFQNDDMDLIAETVNPDNPNQVQFHGQWVDLQSRTEIIKVKGAADVALTLRRSPHGPIVNDALAALPAGPEQLPGSGGSPRETRPIALWWALLETENPVLDAFYPLARADRRGAARAAGQGIHAPGLNVVWANATGDIAWWAAAKLPRRPAGVRPNFLLDGATAEADKDGFLPFSANPQEENPARGYVISANHQPAGADPVPGYYNPPERAQRLNHLLADDAKRWNTAAAQALQLDVRNEGDPRVLAPLLPALRQAATDDAERALIERLARWSGDYDAKLVEPVLYQQFIDELLRAALADELGEPAFGNLLQTRSLENALPRLAADAASPWWDDRSTTARESRELIAQNAWKAALKHLRATFGADPAQWTWARAHRLTHHHPLGMQPPLDRLFNVGEFGLGGGREVPNNLAHPLGMAPWSVAYGPSTRRVVDFGHPAQAQGINPVGQSGVWPDQHFRDQAEMYVRGQYRPEYTAEADVAAHTRSTLTLKPPQ